jgi:hypothetical protein
MLKTSLLTMAALLASTATFAAAPKVMVRPNGVIVTPDHLTIAANRPRPIYSQAPALERGLTKIFDNLSRYPDGVYWCCTSSLISGPNSEFGSQVWIGAPFTPSANSTVSKIVLGLNYDSGTNAMVVALNKDSGGLPGKELASARVSGLPDFPSCCAVAQAKFNDVPLSAGQQYWVVVRTDKKTADTFGGWSFNDTEQVNEVTEAINDGTGWQRCNPLQRPPLRFWENSCRTFCREWPG